MDKPAPRADTDRRIFEEDPNRLDNPVLSFFLDYWHRKRQGEAVPLARDFDPQEVRTHLRWVVVVDALPEYADFRYRVVGTSVCEYFLANGTGKTVSEAFGDVPDLIPGIIRIYTRTCLGGKPIRYSAPAAVVNGLFFPQFDALYLPYSTTGERVDRLVSAFVFNQNLMHQNRTSAIADLLPGLAIPVP